MLIKYGYVGGNPVNAVDPEGLTPSGRYTKWCGRCSVTYDSDQWKGPHTHWQCPGQPQGCVKKDGSLCDNSAPPPENVKQCLKDWGRIPDDQMYSVPLCESNCQKVLKQVVDAATGLLIFTFVLVCIPIGL